METMPKERILIDADTGFDVALAILYAIRSPKLHVEGITTVFGNTSAEQAADNTLRLLAFVRPGYEIPVAVGAAAPLARKLDHLSTHVHGANGMGNVELPPSAQKPLDESGAAYIVRKANEEPGVLTLVTLASMTNLALALELDPALPSKLKRIVAMGGAIHVPGNVTPVAEANFYKDPESADRVLTSGLPVVLVGLDVTLKTRISQRNLDYLNRFGQEEAKGIITFMESVLQHYFRFYQGSNHFFGEAPLHDPLAVMILARPELVTRREMKVRVECEGTFTSGMVVADLRVHPREGWPVEVCVDVQGERAVGEFLSVFL